MGKWQTTFLFVCLSTVTPLSLLLCPTHRSVRCFFDTRRQKYVVLQVVLEHKPFTQPPIEVVSAPRSWVARAMWPSSIYTNRHDATRKRAVKKASAKFAYLYCCVYQPLGNSPGSVLLPLPGNNSLTSIPAQPSFIFDVDLEMANPLRPRGFWVCGRQSTWHTVPTTVIPQTIAACVVQYPNGYTLRGPRSRRVYQLG